MNEEIGGYFCSKQDLNIQMVSRTEKRNVKDDKYYYKNMEFLDCWESYREFQVDQTIRKKPKKKNIELSVWLTDNFPIEFRSLINIVQVLGIGNKIF